jgi:hypothetical protein
MSNKYVATRTLRERLLLDAGWSDASVAIRGPKGPLRARYVFQWPGDSGRPRLPVPRREGVGRFHRSPALSGCGSYSNGALAVAGVPTEFPGVAFRWRDGMDRCSGPLRTGDARRFPREFKTSTMNARG